MWVKKPNPLTPQLSPLAPPSKGGARKGELSPLSEQERGWGRGLRSLLAT